MAALIVNMILPGIYKPFAKVKRANTVLKEQPEFLEKNNWKETYELD
jgi:hypothetical protein